MRILILFALLLVSKLSIAQNTLVESELIQLTKVYKKYHVSTPSQEVYEELDAIKSPDLQETKLLIQEIIKPNNNILSTQFLTKPDTSTLVHLHLIRRMTWNMFSASDSDPTYGLDSLKEQTPEYNELLSILYDMLFSSIINKHKPFDLSSVNLDMDSYQLANDTEKGILFLELMEVLGNLISGYFMVEPPNYEKPMDYIKNFPTFDGMLYYQYKNIDIEDFMITTSSKKPKESFKHYKLNQFMNVVLRHAICLSTKENSRDQMVDILYSSILKNEEYWQYSRSQEVLEEIFK